MDRDDQIRALLAENEKLRAENARLAARDDDEALLAALAAAAEEWRRFIWLRF